MGWELYVPAEFAVGVYEDLVGAGSDLGLVDAGYYAINSLRLDKGYRAFGSDLTPDYTPLEAGLRFTCKLANIHRLRGPERYSSRPLRRAPARRLVSFQVREPTFMLWGGELVLHNGAPAGQVDVGGLVGHVWVSGRARLCVAIGTADPSVPTTCAPGPGR